LAIGATTNGFRSAPDQQKDGEVECVEHPPEAAADMTAELCWLVSKQIFPNDCA